MKRLIIRGYYGRDNLGDELMKEVFIKSFKHPSIDLRIMNSSPEDLSSKYGIETPDELVTGSVPSVKNAFKRFFTILKADVYAYGGGTIITDKHSYYHLVENSIYFLFRKLLGKKSFLISAGATRFKTKAGLFWARRLIGFSDKAYIRDEDSFSFLKSLTHNSKKLVQSADIVLLTRDTYPIEKNKEKLIGLCLMPYYYATYHKNADDEQLRNDLVKQISHIAEKHKDYRFILIPIQSGKNNNTDYCFCEQIYGELKDNLDIELVKTENNEDKIHAIQRCEYLISMRLHALMLAKFANIKLCAIDHNEKIQSFMRRYDSIANCVKLNELTRLSECFLNLESVRENGAMMEDYNLAKGNISIILQGLDLKSNP